MALDAVVWRPVLEATGWALLHFLWQGGLIGLIATLCLYAARHRESTTRYAIACVFFASMPCVVVGTFAWHLSNVRVSTDDFAYLVDGRDLCTMTPW